MENLYIGVDLGGTNIAAGIVNEKGEILYKLSIPTDLPQPESVIEEKICSLCFHLCEKSGFVLGKDINFVGIGTPGNVDNETGIVGFNANFGYENWRLKEKIEQKLHIKTAIENDANTAIIAEAVAGCAQNCKDAVILTLGTGIGAGVLIDGKVYTGYNKSGTEIGHMVIEANGRKCNCGRKGCFEKYASASALVYDAKQAMEKDKNSVLWSICPDTEKLNAKNVFDAAQQGDLTAKETVDNFISYLACGLINVVNIFQPEILCIGGGISNQNDVLIKPLQEYLDREDYARNSQKRVTLKIAKFTNDAGIIGAGLIEVING